MIIKRNNKTKKYKSKTILRGVNTEFEWDGDLFHHSKRNRGDEIKEWIIKNTNDTYVGNEDSVLFVDDAIVGFNQINDIAIKLTEYDNVINNNDLKINWGKVNILTNKNKSNINDIISNLPETMNKIKNVKKVKYPDIS